MSDTQIRERLKFTEQWFALGIVDGAWVQQAVREFRESDDHGDEHYRYGAFFHYLQRHSLLAPSQCRSLFELGRSDPDKVMGTSMMLDVLKRKECPDDLYERAAMYPPTAKYVAELRERRDSGL